MAQLRHRSLRLELPSEVKAEQLGGSARRWLVSATMLVVAVAAFATAEEASAKRNITTGIAAPEYVSPDAPSRNLWFDRTVEANASLARVDVIWYTVARSERPQDPRDPADPGYDFSSIDAAVRSAEQRDLDVLFTVYGAPAWAEGPNRPEAPAAGSWKPDPREFGSFAGALAKRYSGRFPDPAGPGTLPKVTSYEAWNEPNLGWFFLAPQWEDGRALGPTMYRELLNSFYDAVHEVDPANVVVGGATSPFGHDRVDARAVRRPLAFLRSLFCLKGRRKLTPQPCPGVRMDALSHHALSHERPAGYNAVNPDDAASGDLDRVKRVLRAAERAGTVQPGGKRPIWVTEFWWISDPPAPTQDSAAIPERKQARNIARALYGYWRERAQVAIQYLIRDPGGGSPWNTGLFFAGGKPKLALRAFRFPFVTERLRRKRVRAWGISPSSGRVKIQGQKGGGWRTLMRLRAREGKVFTAKLRGTKRMRAEVGGETSFAWSGGGKGR